ncbi:hypothetical protein [Nitrobacter winogradskyi]|jgi:hypothetical protein|uniref:hypothetical protein n=1 Tax=Nitrobacter winogradskyi TaxID=913 RepID=UPI00164FA546|nr:hypothetical protein [Nitrobacter winogradskyi]
MQGVSAAADVARKRQMADRLGSSKQRSGRWSSAGGLATALSNPTVAGLDLPQGQQS